MPVPSAYDIEQMRQRYGERATPAQIAKMLRCCEADVKAALAPVAQVQAQTADEGEGPRFKWTPETEKLARLMREMGKSSAEIGAAVGCSGAAVRLRWKTKGEAA